MKRQHFLQAALALVVICVALLAYTPPFSRDALIHHLQVPLLYLQHGGIYEIPELKFSYYPMNLDLLYLWALWLGSDILPKYIHAAFAFATALLLHQHLKKRLSDTYAWLGVVFFLSIPIIIKLSITVYVDLGLVFFSTASLLLIFRWLETEQRRDLLLAGICCGLCIGTKYNGLLVFFLLTFMVPMLFIKMQSQKKGTAVPALKATVLFCLMALLAASPLLIRNAAWTGNPIYPLYNGFFSRISNVTTAEEEHRQPADEEDKNEAKQSSPVKGVFARRYILYKENIWQLLLLPVRIFIEGQDGDPRYFDGRLNPFLLVLALLAFVRSAEKKRRNEQIALAAFSLFYFLYAFNTGVLRIRYLVPMVPCLVILSMYGLNNLEKMAEKYLNRKVAQLSWSLIVLLLLFWNGNYIREQFKEVDPLSYITGRLDRDQYLSKQLAEYPIMQYVNTHLPESAKILCLFMGNRGYYLQREHLFEEYSNTKWLLSWLQQPEASLATLQQKFQQQKITHLLIRADLMVQWLNNAEPHQQQLWNQLNRQHLLAEHTHLNYILYQVTFR
ncbi:MAG: phospholipid carrier-dependent glycosyltransferase [Candidatus Electrothrix sp. AU1_5]|nr:phospholipid carrier-dependent glycosyltransferase [Candidatus Electrothrix gigas]